MLSVATILMDKMYLIGTDPMNIMHTVVTVPMDKIGRYPYIFLNLFSHSYPLKINPEETM